MCWRWLKVQIWIKTNDTWLGFWNVIANVWTYQFTNGCKCQSFSFYLRHVLFKEKYLEVNSFDKINLQVGEERRGRRQKIEADHLEIRATTKREKNLPRTKSRKRVRKQKVRTAAAELFRRSLQQRSRFRNRILLRKKWRRKTSPTRISETSRCRNWRQRPNRFGFQIFVM